MSTNKLSSFFSDPIRRFFSVENILITGFCVFILIDILIPQFGNNFERIPGDLTDARFNNYLLENGYSYLTGKSPVFWNAPFCYPEPDIISWSDNFIGQLPLYSLFRVCGLDLQSAYQGWMLLTQILNFGICAWVLFKFTRNKTAAMLGAFVFSFALPVYDQNYHSQMMARYAIPLAFYFFIRFMKGEGPRNLFFLLMSVVLQFYLSIYLGFLLSLALCCTLFGYLLLNRKEIPFRNLFALKQLKWYALYLAVSAGLLLMLMKPYLVRSKQSPPPPIEQVMSSLPEPGAYVLTSFNATSWRDLNRVPEGMIDFWNKFLFPGGLASLAVFILLVILIRTGYVSLVTHPEQRLKLGMSLLAGFMLLFLFTLRVHQKSLYSFVYQIPGFNAMRDLCRVVNVQLFFYAAMVALLGGLLLEKIKRPWLRNAFTFLMLTGVVVDNAYDSAQAVTYSKADSEARFMDIVEKVKSHPDYQKFE
ncbi:MAG TPA: hypothetical protein VNZ86_05570, partial [Bacteroidia bacterium]|nr:hypothetical protein [Bacteroidia bacterium]